MSTTSRYTVEAIRTAIEREARGLYLAGILCFPASEKAKHPDRVKHWAPEHYPPNGWPDEQLHTVMFRQPDALRLFVVCGTRSDGTVCIDFDQAGLFEQWAALIPEDLFYRLYLEQSEHSGRYHVVARGTDQMESCVPAREPRKPDGTNGDIRIEVRGEGNGFMAAPSVGYQWIQGDLANLPVLTPDEYQTLLSAAAAFNECEPHPQPEPKKRVVRPPTDAELPGTRYNRENGQAEVLALFQQYGYEIGRRDARGNVSITRPGATSDTSGNVSAEGVTHIFSTNTPFEPSATGDGNPLSPFAVYATLEHGGDFRAARKALHLVYEPKRKSEPTNGASPNAKPLGDPETGEILSIADTTPIDRKLNEVANAHRFVRQHGEKLRYCKALDTWFIWDGVRWRADETGAVMQMAKATAASVYREAADAPEAMREEVAKWARRSHFRAGLTAMVALAQSDPAVAIRPADLDTDRWVLNCLNGTLDLKTGELRPHKPADLITKLAPVVYDPDATLPLFDHFLHEATGGDNAFAAFLRRAAGCTLAGENLDEVIFLPHGPAATGKSTFLEAFKATLGDYAKTADFETFLKKRGDAGIRNDVARLAGARFVVSIEVDEGKQLAMALLKTLSGGEDVSARFLYQEAFEYRPAFTLWLAANHAPNVGADDDAAWRRILRLPFPHVVPKEKRDPKVKATLRDPAIAGPAILAWAMRGCMEWQRDGLGVPTVVENATEDYRREMNPIMGWVEECCDLSPQAWTATSRLWPKYQEWEKDQHREGRITKERFTGHLKTLGCTAVSRRPEGKLTRGWQGVAFKEDDTPRGDTLPIDSDPSVDNGDGDTRRDTPDTPRYGTSGKLEPCVSHVDELHQTGVTGVSGVSGVSALADRALCRAWLQSGRVALTLDERHAAQRILGEPPSVLARDFRAKLAPACGVDDREGVMSDPRGVLAAWIDDVQTGWNTEPMVPEAVRQSMQRLGIPFDAFETPQACARRVDAWIRETEPPHSDAAREPPRAADAEERGRTRRS